MTPWNTLKTNTPSLAAGLLASCSAGWIEDAVFRLGGGLLALARRWAGWARNCAYADSPCILCVLSWLPQCGLLRGVTTCSIHPVANIELPALRYVIGMANRPGCLCFMSANICLKHVARTAGWRSISEAGMLMYIMYLVILCLLFVTIYIYIYIYML